MGKRGSGGRRGGRRLERERKGQLSTVGSGHQLQGQKGGRGAGVRGEG